MPKNEYNADSIEDKEFPYNVRDKVGMYLGSASQSGFEHTLDEIVDNSMDEVSAGHGDTIIVKVNSETNTISVRDFGRGIPIGIKKNGDNALISALTKLHSGGKHNNTNTGNYNFSAGINGVGLSCTVATSERLFAQVWRDKKTATVEFNQGLISKELTITPYKGDEKVGTFIEWTPSIKTDEFDKNNVFESNCRFDKERTINRLKYQTYLNPGLYIILIFDGETIDFKKEDCLSKVLIKENKKLVFIESPIYSEELMFIKHMDSGEKSEINLDEWTKFSLNEKSKYDMVNMKIDFSFNISEDENPSQLFFVNGISVRGGKHNLSMQNQFKSIVNEFLSNHNKRYKVEKEDILSNLTFIFSVKINNPLFSGQTKDELNNPEAGVLTTTFMKKYLHEWMSKLEKKELELFFKVLESAKKAREQSAKIKANQFKSIKSLSKTELLSEMGKLEMCTSKDFSKNELFIVEGDSASGGIRTSRSNKYQAFLPLRGKPLNVLKKDNGAKIFLNEEIKSLSYALGGIGQDFDMKNLRFDKIIILADADLDGYHIAALLLTFFYTYYKELIINGHIYVALSPLYKIKYGKDNIEWSFTKMDMENFTIDKVVKDIIRNKGLGEMNPKDLFDTTLNPLNRRLVKVNIEDYHRAENNVRLYMSDDESAKKALREIYEDFYKDNQDKRIIELNTFDDIKVKYAK
jgi:DNA gyrase subunit B